MTLRNAVIPRVVFAGVCVMTSLHAAAAPTDAERQRFVLEHRSTLQSLRQEGTPVGARTIDRLVRLVVEGEQLDWRLADDGLPGEALAALPDGGLARVSIMDVPGDPPMRYVSLLAAWLDETDAVARQAQILPQPMGLNLAFNTETPETSDYAQLVFQDHSSFGEDDLPAGPTASLYFARETDGREPIRIQRRAATFAELIELHYADMRTALLDGLTQIRSVPVLAGVGEADALILLAGAKPLDPSHRHEIDTLLADLRRDGAPAVPSTRARLRGLGVPAIRAFERLPRDGWSADLSLNADTVVAGLLPPAARKGASLLDSRSRLCDLLYSQDTALRRAVVERLETLAGQPVDVDPAREPYANAAQIEAARSRLLAH